MPRLSRGPNRITNFKTKKNTMININSYREATLCDDPWKDSLFTSSSQLTGLCSRDLVTFGRQPILQQHHTTYLTGKDTCHAHHFAKMLATAIIKGDCPNAPSIHVNNKDMGVSDSKAYASTNPVPTVLWIDTVRGPHACADFFREMTAGLDPGKKQFQLLCLDVIGSRRDNFWEVTRRIEFYIKDINPTLVVIDDIDNLMPYCGITVASEFSRVVRDTVNHTETSFLFIGYNHLNKRASTTGNVGKQLFSMASHVFSLTTMQTVTHVRLVNTRDFRFAGQDNDEFHFTIGGDNLPLEVVKAMPSELPSARRDYIEQNTLRDIMTQVIPQGQAVSPDDLTARVAARRMHLNRVDRSRTLIAQATRLGIISKTDGDYTLNPLTNSDMHSPFNNSLTLPPHLPEQSSNHTPPTPTQANL